MRLIKVIVIVSSALITVGCGGNKEEKSKPDITPTSAVAEGAAPVEIDMTTPDRALKSYWKVQDQIRAAYFEHDKAQLSAYHRIQAPAERVMTGAAFNGIKLKPVEFSTFIRDIIDVNVESESRAVIIASIKNSTPIPAGAELSKYDEKSRNEGEKYKYVLEKSPPGWQIAEIWDFKTYTTPPDWSRMIPGDGKPFVSTETYEGR